MLYKIICSLFLILLISSCWEWDNSTMEDMPMQKTLTGWIYSIELNDEEIKTQLQIDLAKIKSDEMKENKRIDDIVNKELADKKLKEDLELQKHILEDEKREAAELLKIEKEVELIKKKEMKFLEDQMKKDLLTK